MVFEKRTINHIFESGAAGGLVLHLTKINEAFEGGIVLLKQQQYNSEIT